MQDRVVNLLLIDSFFPIHIINIVRFERKLHGLTGQCESKPELLVKQVNLWPTLIVATCSTVEIKGIFIDSYPRIAEC